MTQDQPQLRIVAPPEQLPRASARVAEARAMETVSANSLIDPPARAGVARGSIRERAVNGCVKNGKLRLIFAEKLPRHANAGEVARVMQRRKIDAAFDRCFHIGGHAHRFAKLGATMHNAMADHINLLRLAHNPVAPLSPLHPCSRLRCLLHGGRCV